MSKNTYSMHRQIKLPALFFVALVFILASCLKEPSDEVLHTNQLFRPILFNANVNGASVDFTWAPIKNASYRLEFSKDSLRFGNEVVVLALDSMANYTVEDLWSQSRYSARIKAVSKDPAVSDSEYQVITFVTGTENILSSIDSSAVAVNSVRLNWDSTKTVTDVKVFLAEQLTNTLEIIEAEKINGVKVIGGLKPETTYLFSIYSGEKIRGTVSTTTKAKP